MHPRRDVAVSRACQQLICCKTRMFILAMLCTSTIMQATAQPAQIRIPWLLPHSEQAKLPFKGLHDSLPQLLSVQNNERWVTVGWSICCIINFSNARSDGALLQVFMFTKPIARYMLNAVYSFITHGRAQNYIVATMDEDSLQLCMEYHLPCYNASITQRQLRGSQSSLSIGRQSYNAMVWSKVMFVQTVLQLRYHVHFSDVDVTYVRSVYASYIAAFAKYQVDAIFMEEPNLKGVIPVKSDAYHAASPHGVKLPNIFNTGVYAIKSNSATLQLMEAWLAASTLDAHDQRVLNNMAFKKYVLCSSAASCISAKLAGWTAIYAHPPQFGAARACPGKPAADPCSLKSLFIHAICTDGWDTGAKPKSAVMDRYELWLVDEAGMPLYDINGQSSHPYMPCKGLAWTASPAAMLL